MENRNLASPPSRPHFGFEPAFDTSRRFRAKRSQPIARTWNGSGLNRHVAGWLQEVMANTTWSRTGLDEASRKLSGGMSRQASSRRGVPRSDATCSSWNRVRHRCRPGKRRNRRPNMPPRSVPRRRDLLENKKLNYKNLPYTNILVFKPSLPTWYFL